MCNFDRICYNVQGCNSCGCCHQQWHNGCNCCMGMRNCYRNRNLNSVIPNQQGSNVASSQFGAPQNCYQGPFKVNRGLGNEFVSRIRSYNFTRINLNTRDDNEMATSPSGAFGNHSCAQGSVSILFNQSPNLVNVEESIATPYITERPMQSSSIGRISIFKKSESQDNFNNEDRTTLKSGTESTNRSHNNRFQSSKPQDISKNNRMVGYGCVSSEPEMTHYPSGVAGSQSTCTLASIPTFETRAIPAGDRILEPHAIMHSLGTRLEVSVLFKSSPKILTVEESVGIPSNTARPMQSSAVGPISVAERESLDNEILISKPSSQSIGIQVMATCTISTRGEEDDSKVVESSLTPIKNEDRKTPSVTKITQNSQENDNVIDYGSMNCDQLPEIKASLSSVFGNQSSCTQDSKQTVGTNVIKQSLFDESIGISSTNGRPRKSYAAYELVASQSGGSNDKAISTTSTVNKVGQPSLIGIQNDDRKTLSSDKKRYNRSYTKRYKSTQTEDTQNHKRMVGFGDKLPGSESIASDGKAKGFRNTEDDNQKFNTSIENTTKPSNKVKCTCKRKIPFTRSIEKINCKATSIMNTSNYQNMIGQCKTKMSSNHCRRCNKRNSCMRNDLEKICFCKPFIEGQMGLESISMRESTEGVQPLNTLPLENKNIIDSTFVRKTKDSKRPTQSKQPSVKAETTLEKAKGKSKQKKKFKLMSSSDKLVIAKQNSQETNDIWFNCNVPLRLSIPNEITLEHLLQTNCHSLANNNNRNACFPKSEMQRITIHPTCIRNAEDPSLATGPSANIAQPLPQSLCSNLQPMEQFPFSPYFQNSALPFFPNSMPGPFQNLGPTSFQANLPPYLPISSPPIPTSYPNTFSYQPFPYKSKKPVLGAEKKHKQKKKEHFRKKTCRQWLSEMFCFKKMLENYMCEKTLAPCRLCYCNCKIRSKEVQTPICRCKECTLHLRKNEFQKRIKAKLKRTRVESISTQNVDNSGEKNCSQSNSQQNKLKSTKTKRSSDESLVVSLKSKTLSDKQNGKLSKTVNYNKTNDRTSKSKSIISGKDKSKVSNVLKTLNNTIQNFERIANQSRSEGGDIQHMRPRRSNAFDFRDNNFTLKSKNKRLDCRRLNQNKMELSKTSNVEEYDVKLTDPDIYQTCTTCLPKSINERSSSSKSVCSELNIFLVKQESNLSPAYLEEYTITACGRYPMQNEDCDLRRLSSGMELNECCNNKNTRSVLEDLKCFFQQKSARNGNAKDRLIVMRKPDEWRELDGSQQLLKIGKKPSQSSNKINCSCGNRKTNYPIYKPQINRNSASASRECPKCCYKCSKSERHRRKVNDAENLVFENQSEQDDEVNVLLKPRPLRNSSVGPPTLEQNSGPSNGIQKKSKVCICSLKLLQTLREEHHLRQIKEKKNSNYNKYFLNCQHKEEKRKAGISKNEEIHLELGKQTSATKEKPAQVHQFCQASVERLGQKEVSNSLYCPHQQQQEPQNDGERQEEQSEVTKQSLSGLPNDEKSNLYGKYIINMDGERQEEQSEVTKQSLSGLPNDEKSNLYGKYIINVDEQQQQLCQLKPLQEHQKMEKYSNSCRSTKNSKDHSKHTLTEEAAYICYENNVQNIQQELKLKNPLEPSESYLENSYCNWCCNSQKQQQEYYFQREEENTNFENLGTFSPHKQHNCYLVEDTKQGSSSHNMQPHHQYVVQCPHSVCSDNNDRMRCIDNGEFTEKREQGNRFQEQQSVSALCEGILKEPKPRMVSNQAYIEHEDDEIFTQYSPEEVPSEIQHQNVKLNSCVSDFYDNCMKYSQKSLHQTPNEKQLHLPLDCMSGPSCQCQYTQLDQKECNLHLTCSEVNCYQNIRKRQELDRNSQKSDIIRYMDCVALIVQRQEEDRFQEQQSEDQIYDCSASCKGILIQPQPSVVSNQAYIQNVDNELFTQQSQEVHQKLHENSPSQVKPESGPLNYYVYEFDDRCLCAECYSQKSLQRTQKEPFESRYSETDSHQLSTILGKTLYFPNDTLQVDHEVQEQQECYLQSIYSDVNYSQNMQQQQQEQEVNGSFQELDRIICIESDALPILLQEEQLSDKEISSASCECILNQAYIQQADNEIITEYSPKNVPQNLQLNSPSQIQPMGGQYNCYDFDYLSPCAECNSQISLQLTKNEQEQPIPFDSLYCETDFQQESEKTLFSPTSTSLQCQCRQQDRIEPIQQPTYSDANFSKNVQGQQKGQELNRNTQGSDIMICIDCDDLPVQQLDENTCSFEVQLSQNQTLNCSGSCEGVPEQSVLNQASQPENIKLNCYDNYLHYFEEQRSEQQEINSGYSLKSLKNLPQCARMTREYRGNFQDQQLDSLCEFELTSLEEMNPNELKPVLQREINDRSYTTLRPYVTPSTWNVTESTDPKQIPGPLQEAQNQLIRRISRSSEHKEGFNEKKPMIHSGFYWRLIKKYDIQPISDDVQSNMPCSRKKELSFQEENSQQKLQQKQFTTEPSPAKDGTA